MAIVIGQSHDNPIEPTGPADWIVLAYAALVIALLLASDVMMFWRRRHDRTLALKNPPLLLLGSIFATIHIVGTFISNDHLEFLRAFRYANCPLWNFFLQNLAGAAPWFFLLLWRLIVLGKMVRLFPGRKKTIVSALAIFLPIGSLSVVVVAVSGDQYDDEAGTCLTAVIWKLLLFLWFIWSIAYTAWVGSVVNGKLQNEYLSEYRPLRDTIGVGILLLVSYAIINFLGLFSYSMWRSIATGMVPTLHLFTRIRLIGHGMWLALCTSSDTREQHEYVVMKSFRPDDVPHETEILSCDDLERLGLIDKFYSWCYSYPTIHPSNVTRVGYKITYAKVQHLVATWFVDAIRAMQAWEGRHKTFSTVPSVLYEQYHDMVGKWVEPCPLEMTIVMPHVAEYYKPDERGEMPPLTDATSPTAFNRHRLFYRTFLEDMFFLRYKEESLSLWIRDEVERKRPLVELIQ